MIHLDFTDPKTLRKLADLPRYGWAQALVRRAYPLWGVSPDELVTFRVRVERGDEGCPYCDGRGCGEIRDYVSKTITVEATSEEAALEAAEQEMADKGEIGWGATSAIPVVCSAKVPDEYLAWFERPETRQ